MKLYAIGDIHLSYKANREAFDELDPHPGDGLIIVGDVGETTNHLEQAFKIAKNMFDEVWWCPGNHELYSVPAQEGLRGELKYMQCVGVARRYGVHTPEDDFIRWESETGPVVVAPIFTLYDYTFRPAFLKTKEEALRWAEEADTVATDEYLLHPDPHESREAWCEHLVKNFEAKLEAAASQGLPLIIVNHWPLREDLIYIPRVPRFTLWCGTKKTHDWHTRFNAKVVISGHLHVRRTDWKDGVRFEECSLGYPKQWDEMKQAGLDVNALLREILPGPAAPESGNKAMQSRRWG